MIVFFPFDYLLDFERMNSTFDFTVHKIYVPNNEEMLNLITVFINQLPVGDKFIQVFLKSNDGFENFNNGALKFNNGRAQSQNPFWRYHVLYL